MLYFGFAVADGMFPYNCNIHKQYVQPIMAARILKGAEAVTYCVNPSHAATIAAARERYALPIEVPAKPPKISMIEGDKILVMSVQGLPRLTDRHEYTAEEIASAKFRFSVWSVFPAENHTPVAPHETLGDGGVCYGTGPVSAGFDD